MAKFYEDDFWGRVQQRMLDLGLTMTDFTRLADIPYGSIYRQIKAKTPPPKYDQIERMATVLGCSSEYLLTGSRKNENSLSPELKKLVTNYKILNRDQKNIIDSLLLQFVKDNNEYSQLYIQAYGTDPDNQPESEEN